MGLLMNLFYAMTLPGSEESEFVMKAIMRTFSTLQDGVIPYLQQMLPGLTNKLMLVAKNPGKPHFNHYLFETLSLSIKICCKSNRAAVVSFEEAYFPVFQQILFQDVQEFVPYVFQIMSLSWNFTKENLRFPRITCYSSLIWLFHSCGSDPQIFTLLSGSYKLSFKLEVNRWWLRRN